MKHPVQPLEYARPRPQGYGTAGLDWCAVGFLAGAVIAFLFGIQRLHHVVVPIMFVPMVGFGAAWAIRFAIVIRGRRLAPNESRRAMWPSILVVVLAAVIGSVVLTDAIFGEDSHNFQYRNRACQDNMRAIGRLLVQYAAGHGGKYPDTLGALVLDQAAAIPSNAVFICPETRQKPTAAPSVAAVAADINAGRNVSYIYLGKGLTSQATAETVLLYEPPGNHRAAVNALFGDGHVESINSRSVPSFIAELRTGHNPPRVEMLK